MSKAKFLSGRLFHGEGVCVLLSCVLLFMFSCAISQNRQSDSGIQDGIPKSEGPEEISEVSILHESPGINTVPSDLVFLPGSFPSLEIATGVGFITRDAKDRAFSLDAMEKAALTAVYRRAYVDYLLRDAPLSGVLGGDLVHSWPVDVPAGWAQNWRSSAPEANSWGLSELIPAIKGNENDRVFIVQGRILDYYGRSAGVNRANGNTGYGSPRGYEFFYDGNIMQRFDLGLISVDMAGNGSFYREDPPSLEYTASGDTGVFPPASAREDIRAAFIDACNMAIDRGYKRMEADGPGQYLGFSGAAWDFPGGDTVKGMYIQAFNNKSILLVLPDSSLLPAYPRLIASPFIEVLLHPADFRLLGGESLRALSVNYSGGDETARSLMLGLCLYGLPLTDPVAVKGGEGAAYPWQLAQRFSRGWLVGPPSQP